MKNEKLIVKSDDLTLQHHHKLTDMLIIVVCRPRLEVTGTQQAHKKNNIAHQYIAHTQNAKSRFFFGSIS